MNEFFDKTPRHTGVRLSKTFLNRIGRQAEESGRAPMDPTYEGVAGADSSGPWFHPQKEILIWAEIGAGPTISYPGYSWQMRTLKEDGGFTVPEAPAARLSGDNGSENSLAAAVAINVELTDNVATLSTTLPHGFRRGDVVLVEDLAETDLNGTWTITAATEDTFSFNLVHADIPSAVDDGTVTREPRPRSAPAFDPNGSTTIPAGTMVMLMRGYLHTSATNAADLLLVDADDPDSGSAVDSEAAVGREWLIVGSASEGVGAPFPIELRITGRPKCVDDHKFYPAVKFDFDSATDTPATGTTGGWTDSTEVWLRQADDAALGTTGKMKVWAVPDIGAATKEIDGDERPLYGTHDRMAVMKVACVAGEIVNYYEDVYGGCEGGSGGLWANSVFPTSLWSDSIFA